MEFGKVKMKQGSKLKCASTVFLFVAAHLCCFGQQASEPSASMNLPSTPVPQQINPHSSPIAPPAIPQQNPLQIIAGTAIPLSLKDAQALALKNNPQISFARLTALASQQVTREVRSTLWPTAAVELTAVDSEPGSRITAGALNNPTVYPRAAAGATVTQLITDFGRTTNLISSANLAAKAENQNAVATKE